MASRAVLIVEDDPDIVELLTIHLSDLQCTVESTHRGEEGLRKALLDSYDLIVLDVMLPDMEGTEVCRRLRGKDILSPIVMLTAKSEEFDKVLGLEMGADDYITKPFSMREFTARVKAVFRRVDHDRRRHESGSRHAIYRRGDLTVDLDRRKVTVDGRRVELSPKEFELLTLLAAEPGRCYDRNKILNLVWGYDFDGYAHTVNSHINRLRTKIEPNIQEPTYILTNWGVGYRFNEHL